MSEMAQFGVAPRIKTPIAYSEAGLAQRVHDAIERTTRYLLSLQASDGFWVGELQADTTLESDYIYYLYILDKRDHKRITKLANYVRNKQLPDGGWSIYEGGPSELNATIKAYFALKLAGDSTEAPHMAAARRRVHELGGLEKANSYSRIYLALCGLVDWGMVPAMPPELVLLPTWAFLNIYSMSSWTRAIVVPLTILYALRPKWRMPEDIRLDELFRDPTTKIAGPGWAKNFFAWRNFFLVLDRVLKLYEESPWKPLRKLAMRRARQWLMDHLERSEGLGAIYPAMVNSIFALLALGYSPDDPLTAREIDYLARFEIEEDETLRVQPCVSPVWDTAIAMTVLKEAGLPLHHPALEEGAQWLLLRQVVGSGDWKMKTPHAKPGGWAFEFRNDFYPDIDDTSFVLMALQHLNYPDPARLEKAMQCALDWMLNMQNRDGGWGAFDRDNDISILVHVPFADHNAMIDPSSADVTARVLECLGRLGWSPTHPVIKRALTYLERDQTAEGAWFGRWGVNYIYGTSWVLRAMESLGLAKEPCCQRAASWLRSVQNPDGGWGESCASYDDPKLKGLGESTPSQTAWALIGLLATGDVRDLSVMRGVRYLLRHQKGDGSWDEDTCTGTGFPRVFYLKYHMYRNVFPLYALARYQNLRKGATSAEDARPLIEFNPRNGHGRNQ